MKQSSAKTALDRIHKELPSKGNSAVILTLPPRQNTGEKHVFQQKTAKKQRFGSVAGSLRGKKTEKNMTTQLLNFVDDVAQEHQQNNKKCQEMAQKLLCNKATATLIMQETKQSQKEAGKYALALQTMLEFFDAGATIKTGELIEEVTRKHSDLNKTFLKEKAKPMLEKLGILVKREDNNFRWADKNDLHLHLKMCRWGAGETQKGAGRVISMCKSIAPWVQVKANDMQVKKALNDPYCKVHADGTIEQFNKPYKGELTDRDKKLIRERDKAKAEAKLRAEISQFRDKKLQQEISAAHFTSQMESQTVALEAQAMADEIRARREVSRAKLEGYKPVLYILVVLAIWWLIDSNQPEQMPTFNQQTEVQQ